MGADDTPTRTTTATPTAGTSGEADALLLVGSPRSGIRIRNDYYAAYDTERPIFVTDGLRDPAVAREVEDDLSNVTGASPAPAGPGRDAFRSQYQAAYGNEPGLFAENADDATAVLLLANLAGGENTGTAVREGMGAVANPGGETFGPSNLDEAAEAVAAGTDINFAGAASRVGFDANGDLATGTDDVFGFGSGEIQDREQRTLTTSQQRVDAEPAGSPSSGSATAPRSVSRRGSRTRRRARRPGSTPRSGWPTPATRRFTARPPRRSRSRSRGTSTRRRVSSAALRPPARRGSPTSRTTTSSSGRSLRTRCRAGCWPASQPNGGSTLSGRCP
jgi:hypothetical protein